MDRREALKLLTALPAASSVSVANLKPDDVIVVEMPGAISCEAARRFEAYIQTIWPGHKVVILGDGAKLSIARSTTLR